MPIFIEGDSGRTDWIIRSPGRSVNRARNKNSRECIKFKSSCLYTIFVACKRRCVEFTPIDGMWFSKCVEAVRWYGYTGHLSVSLFFLLILLFLRFLILSLFSFYSLFSRTLVLFDIHCSLPLSSISCFILLKPLLLSVLTLPHADSLPGATARHNSFLDHLLFTAFPTIIKSSTRVLSSSFPTFLSLSFSPLSLSLSFPHSLPSVLPSSSSLISELTRPIYIRAALMSSTQQQRTDFFW